jgi:L-ascorbate metabolism protein UlaG (beta-lactamase superfamily)
MKITWYGHACFRLEAAGITIVTDPYTPDRAGLGAVTDPADVVVMSSALDEAHSHWEMVPGAKRVVNALDVVDRRVALGDAATMWSVAASEGSDRPDDPKANAMYALDLDGLTVCHMGDVGNPLNEAQIAAFAGKTDVLLALAGANLTIALDALNDAIEAINPRIVIPMHYWTPSIRYQVGTLENFLVGRLEPIVRVNGSSVDVAAASLPATRTIITLLPALDSAVTTARA